jgi:hypothetical protein
MCSVLRLASPCESPPNRLKISDEKGSCYLSIGSAYLMQNYQYFLKNKLFAQKKCHENVSKLQNWRFGHLKSHSERM